MRQAAQQRHLAASAAISPRTAGAGSGASACGGNERSICIYMYQQQSDISLKNRLHACLVVFRAMSTVSLDADQAEILMKTSLSFMQAFGEHIKFCANKLQLGVNFMNNVPNYDRVVEMQV